MGGAYLRLLEGQGAMNLREGKTAMYMFILVLNKEECLETAASFL